MKAIWKTWSVSAAASAATIVAVGASAASASDLKQDRQQSRAEPKEAETPTPPAARSIVYAQAGVGASYVDLATLNSNDLAIARAGGAGLVTDLHLGVRLVVFTLGPRLRYHAVSSFDLWQLDGELAFHVPTGDWDGYVGFHGGYSFVGELDPSALDRVASSVPARDVRVTGADAGMQLGLDRYFSRFFSVGADFSGALLVMRRPAIATSSDPQFGRGGGAVGYTIGGGLHAAAHF